MFYLKNLSFDDPSIFTLSYDPEKNLFSEITVFLSFVRKINDSRYSDDYNEATINVKNLFSENTEMIIEDEEELYLSLSEKEEIFNFFDSFFKKELSFILSIKEQLNSFLNGTLDDEFHFKIAKKKFRNETEAKITKISVFKGSKESFLIDYQKKSDIISNITFFDHRKDYLGHPFIKTVFIQDFGSKGLVVSPEKFNKKLRLKLLMTY